MDKLDKFIEEDSKKNPEKLQQDIGILKAICTKYNVTVENLIAVSFLLSTIGYGRNNGTANLCRAVAEVIESPIETAETIKARMEGKLQ